MNAVTATTPKGAPVGSAKGIVHLLDYTYLVRSTADPDGSVLLAVGLCDRQLRGQLVERPGEAVTCQGCLDQLDRRQALATGFVHRVRATRKRLGTGSVAGQNTPRYGAEVSCNGCLDANGLSTVIWTTNESGQMPRAEKIADQHYLDAYRAHLTQKEA